MYRGSGAVLGTLALLVGCQDVTAPESQRTVRFSSPSRAPLVTPTAPELGDRVPEQAPVASQAPRSPVPSGPVSPAAWEVSPQLVRVYTEPDRFVRYAPGLTDVTIRVAPQLQNWRVEEVTVSMRENLRGVWSAYPLMPAQTPAVIGPTTIPANQTAVFALDALDPVVRTVFDPKRRAFIPSEVVVTLGLVTTPPLSGSGRPLEVTVRFKQFEEAGPTPD